MEELTQEQIAEQAYAEIEAEKNGDKPGESKATPDKDAKKKPEPDAPNDEQAETEKTDGESGEGNEDKADEKPADGESEAEESGEDRDKKITDYAEKHKMTYAEAKEDVEKTEEILKQYKNDPAEMARAMRNKDREYHKLRSEAEKAAAKKEPVFQRMTDDQFIEFAKAELGKKPEFIEKYRAKFPARSESMSDEAIIEEIADRELAIYHDKATEKETEIKTTAARLRDEMISSLPESDRRFIPDVKALMEKIGDNDLIRNEGIIQDALKMVKGARYDADIKAAEERGFKRAKEGAQIVGVKASAEGSKGAKPKGGVVLNDRQKSKAEDMYGHTYSPEECHRLYKETFEDELKKDPKFV